MSFFETTRIYWFFTTAIDDIVGVGFNNEPATIACIGLEHDKAWVGSECLLCQCPDAVLANRRMYIKPSRDVCVLTSA